MVLSNLEISKQGNLDKAVSLISEISEKCAAVDMIVLLGDFIDQRSSISMSTQDV